MWRPSWLAALGVFMSAGAPFAAMAAPAANYPTGPVRIIVPFPAGGTIDSLARHLSPMLAERFGQSVVIDNRAGANGIIGTETVARAAPDGQTLLLVTASFAINQKAYKKIPYHVINDFIPITPLATSLGLILAVHPSVPANTVQELVELSKKPGVKMNYSSPGIGNTVHLATELFKQKSGAKLLHVPYKGSAPALNALLAGEVHAEILPPGIALENIKAGKIKVLAFTGSKRLPEMPDVPTLRESGIDMTFQDTWIGLFAPAGTPDPVVDKIYTEFKAMLDKPRIRDLIRGDGSGYVADGKPPAAFAKQVRDDVERYGQIM
ncbi:MAG TPA: tripartite tricarboxylate transporter substrate binding protein, partial [Burkholderiaceae bacterium]|nr:tripartite tricarboxylate transporter substrate binding protein [Burkholderiaceae bacterium]